MKVLDLWQLTVISMQLVVYQQTKMTTQLLILEGQQWATQDTPLHHPIMQHLVI